MTEPRGTIYLISRAPVTPDYQHTIDFKSPNEQLAFWGSLRKYTLTEYTYVRRERRYIQVAKTFEELEGVNYLMYQNRTGGKWFYCFVVDREYVNDELTKVYFEIDVIQTFLFDYEVKPSYISQSHVDRWDAEHKPIYSRTEEGLNYGSEYVTEAAYRMEDERTENKTPRGFYLIYCTAHSAMIESGIASETTKINGNPIPYVVYMLPVNYTANGSPIPVTVKFFHSTAEGFASDTVSYFEEVMDFMSKSAFGNYVQQIIYVPYMPLNYNIVGSFEDTFEFSSSNNGDCRLGITALKDPNGDAVTSKTIKLVKIIEITPKNVAGITAEMDIFEGIAGEMPQPEQWNDLKSNPRKVERDRRFESKLLCFPYRYNIFTDWRGAPALIKNEYISGDKITVKNTFGWGFNNPQRFYIENYRKDPEGRECSITQPIPMEQPVLSDAYYSYLLQNRNQISANITNSSINTAMSMTGAALSGIGGIVGGVATQNYAGAVSSGINAIFSGINAVNNHEAMIRSQNAKQADIRNMPDTVKNPNDCCFNLADGTQYVTIYRKKICCEFAEQLAQYWHMYGYRVNRLEVPNTKSRVRFNYVKTVGANIVGDMEQQYLHILRQIYDNGVTFWHYSATDFYPMDYSYENVEVKLI